MGKFKEVSKDGTIKGLPRDKISVLTDKMDFSNELQGGSFQSEQLDTQCPFISVGGRKEDQASDTAG